MKKLLTLIVALLAIFNLSAQVYKVGDCYDVDGKRGVVFEVSDDGKHGKIIAVSQPAEKMTWHKAMEWAKGLNDGWYIPSFEEFEVLLKEQEVVCAKLRELGVKPPYWSWSTTDFGGDFVWAVSLRNDSKGGFYKGNDFNLCIISKF